MAFGIIRRIANATAQLAGLMSAADKTKLDGIEAGATATAQPLDNLTSESTTAPLSANQGRVLKGLIDGSGIESATYTLSATAESSYVMSATKYGRMVTLSCNTGGALTSALAAQALLTTLDAAFRPATGIWLYGSISASEGVRLTVEASGAVRVQQVVPTGSYIRFSATYISLT